MSRITLNQFAISRAKTKAAQLLGMSQGALNKALRGWPGDFRDRGIGRHLSCRRGSPVPEPKPA